MDFAELMAKIGFTVDQASINKVNQTVGSIKGMIGKALGAIGIGFSLKALNAAVEQVRSVNMALKSAVGQFGNIDEIQKDILKSSKEGLDYISSLESKVKGISFDNNSLNELINKVPEASKVLSDYFQTSEDKLHDMAQSGEIAVNDVKNALIDAEKGLNQIGDIKGIPQSVIDSFREGLNLVSEMESAVEAPKFDISSLENLLEKTPQAEKILSDYFKVSEEKLHELVKDGAVAINDVKTAFQDAGKAVEQFDGIRSVQEKILETSKDVVGNYEDIAKNVSDLVKNNKTLFDVDKAIQFTDTMTKLVKLSGGSNAEASGLISSMASDFKHGRVSSGIIEQLINKVPEATKILTQYYGVNEQRLRTMAQAGLLRAKDLQKAFADAGESVNQAFEEMGPRITDVLSSARSEFNYFIEETDEMFGITQNIAKFLRSGFQTLMRWLQDARSKLQALSDKVGGFQNILKTIAAILIAMNFDKVVKGVQSLTSAFSTMGVKGMLIVGIIALLLLSLEDLVYFMQGKDSLLGRIFDKAGIDSEKARDMITGAWGGIKDFLANAWQGIKDWWDENGEGIIEGLKGVVQAITRIVNGAWKAIQRIWASISGWWDENGEAITEKVVGLFGTIKDDLIAAWHAIEEWWDEHGESVIELIAGAFTGLLDACGPLIDALKDLWELLKALITGDFEGAWESFKKIGEDIVNAFAALAQSLYETELGKKAMDWGSKFVANFAAGITGGYEALKNALGHAANDIREFFGLDPIFEDDRGTPVTIDDGKINLLDNDTGKFGFMPNLNPTQHTYFSNLSEEEMLEAGKAIDEKLLKAKGVIDASGAPKNIYGDPTQRWSDYPLSAQQLIDLDNKANNVLGGLKTFAQSATVQPQTMGNVTDSHDENYQINQEVTVNNTFNGDGQQNSYAAAKKIETEVARELGRPLQLLHAR